MTVIVYVLDNVAKMAFIYHSVTKNHLWTVFFNENTDTLKRDVICSISHVCNMHPKRGPVCA